MRMWQWISLVPAALAATSVLFDGRMAHFSSVSQMANVSFDSIQARTWGWAPLERYLTLASMTSRFDQQALRLTLDASATPANDHVALYSTVLSTRFPPDQSPSGIVAITLSFQPMDGYGCAPNRTFQLLYNQVTNLDYWARNFELDLTTNATAFGSTMALTFCTGLTQELGPKYPVAQTIPVDPHQWNHVILLIGTHSKDISFYHAKDGEVFVYYGTTKSTMDIDLSQVQAGILTYDPLNPNFTCSVAMNVANFQIVHFDDMDDFNQWAGFIGYSY